MSRVVELPDLIIPAGREDSNELRASEHFGDAKWITIYAPTGVWTEPPPGATGILGIEISPVEFSVLTDWRLVGSDDHTAGEHGIKLQAGSARTIPVCFRSIRLHGFSESFDRAFKASKVVPSESEQVDDSTAGAQRLDFLEPAVTFEFAILPNE